MTKKKFIIAKRHLNVQLSRREIKILLNRCGKLLDSHITAFLNSLCYGSIEFTTIDPLFIQKFNGDSIKQEENVLDYISALSPDLKDDILKNKKILVPIHISNHWIIGVFKNNEFDIYDSLRSSCNYKEVQFLAKVFAHIFNKEVQIIRKPTPYQNDSINCGVFCCYISEKNFLGEPLKHEISDDFLHMYRKHIFERIVSNIEKK